MSEKKIVSLHFNNFYPIIMAKGRILYVSQGVVPFLRKMMLR